MTAGGASSPSEVDLKFALIKGDWTHITNDQALGIVHGYKNELVTRFQGLF